jgi:hypothetical protein
LLTVAIDGYPSRLLASMARIAYSMLQAQVTRPSIGVHPQGKHFLPQHRLRLRSIAYREAYRVLQRPKLE